MHLKLTTLFALLLAIGCSREDQIGKVSANLVTLREIIDLQIPAKSARWETFGTPEYNGGVPGPTDYITLVAELESDSSENETNKVPTGITYIAPEAARPWLSDDFRTILAQNKNTDVDLSRKAECRKYATTLKKTGKPVGGFVCSKSGQMLLYLTLWSEQPSATEPNQ
jgi:hypothetical protein